MGYFKRTVGRGRALAAKRAFLEAARDAEPGPWEPCARALPTGADCFLRFVVERPRGGCVGVFRVNGSLDELADLPPSAHSGLRQALRWFNRRLPIPRRLPRTAVCWFRADAADSIAQVRTLIEVYRVAGVRVLMRATRSPGRIVYRDRYQVAAVPYPDRRTTASVT